MDDQDDTTQYQPPLAPPGKPQVKPTVDDDILKREMASNLNSQASTQNLSKTNHTTEPNNQASKQAPTNNHNPESTPTNHHLQPGKTK